MLDQNRTQGEAVGEAINQADLCQTEWIVGYPSYDGLNITEFSFEMDENDDECDEGCHAAGVDWYAGADEEGKRPLS